MRVHIHAVISAGLILLAGGLLGAFQFCMGILLPSGAAGPGLLLLLTCISGHGLILEMTLYLFALFAVARISSRTAAMTACILGVWMSGVTTLCVCLTLAATQLAAIRPWETGFAHVLIFSAKMLVFSFFCEVARRLLVRGFPRP